MDTIRAFIAIQLPDNVKNALAQVNDNLAAQLPHRSVRWVKPHLMHLTLCFLGDTAVSLLPSIKNVLDESAIRHNPFILHLDQLGCFPNCKKPRVIWVGLQGEVDAANGLKQDIDRGLQPLGWEREDRPFRPHLTLGRIKDGRELRDTQWTAQIEKQEVRVTAIHLVESKLTPDGPIYTIRHNSPLRTT
jgi:RNA 2',3'-cyclic 3'-phosphodiesterase